MKSFDAVAAAGSADWLTGRQAAKLCGRNSYTIIKLALIGRIRFRAERGENVRFLREDVLRLKGE